MSKSLAELAKLTDAECEGDSSHLISGVENIEAACIDQAAFLYNPRYSHLLKKSEAGVVCVHPKVERIEGQNYLISEMPSLVFQKLIELFLERQVSGFTGVHPSAVIHESAVLDPSVSVGPNSVIDRDVHIEAHTAIGPNVTIGASVSIGKSCEIHANVVIREGCILKNRIRIQPSAVIGSCGFGYVTDKQGKHIRLEQLGNVILEDDVDVGANTCIDRARFKSTKIGAGSKIDNLVQIGHQVELGESNMIVSQVGISGSTKTGKHVVMGGQVGVIGHVTIADGVTLAARTGVVKKIEKPGIYSGAPATPIREFNKHMVQLKNVGKMLEKFEAFEKKKKRSFLGFLRGREK